MADTGEILADAREGGYGVGAFNIYNMEGAMAVVSTAEMMRSPVILQLLPSALEIGGRPLVALCREMARGAEVPVSVHLDHCCSPEMHAFALECGVSSVMADGSAFDLQKNISFTAKIVDLAKAYGAVVEGEIGRLSGEEDGLEVSAREAMMTSPEEAAEFAEKSGVSALAVCIGNVHGPYRNEPNLDFARLARIAEVVDIPLVLHGTSGLPDAMITQAIQLGVAKFNVNTEIRTEYLSTLRSCLTSGEKCELIDLMQASMAAMAGPIRQKIALFCSANKA